MHIPDLVLSWIADDGSTATLNVASGAAATVGRSPDCSVSTTDATVSRRHACIGLDAQPWAEDTGSSGGSWFERGGDCRPIPSRGRVSLDHGDVVRCGGLRIRIDWALAAALPTPGPTPLGEAYVMGIGQVVIEARVHDGSLFDVFRVRQGARRFAVKTPRRLARQPAGLGLATWSGIETSLWFGHAGFFADAAPDGLAGVLLALEAERIHRTRGAWNHSVECLSAWDGPYCVQDDFHSGAGRFRHALVMPWVDAVSLADLPQAEQRQCVPRMLPALWDALCAAPHGDLTARNILIDLSAGRFSLIDPAVLLTSSQSGDRHVDLLTVFTTTGSAYPLLPPFWFGEVPADLSAALGGPPETFLQAGRAVAAGDPLTWVPGTAPSVPDRLAIGVLLYEALCGHHPLFDELFGAPAWAGSYGEGVRSPESQAAARARLARGLVPPSAHASDVTQGEDNLALALLNLRVSSRTQLVELLRDSADRT